MANFEKRREAVNGGSNSTIKLNNVKGSGEKEQIGHSGGCKVYWHEEEKRKV